MNEAEQRLADQLNAEAKAACAALGETESPTFQVHSMDVEVAMRRVDRAIQKARVAEAGKGTWRDKPPML